MRTGEVAMNFNEISYALTFFFTDLRCPVKKIKNILSFDNIIIFSTTGFSLSCFAALQPLFLVLRAFQ